MGPQRRSSSNEKGRGFAESEFDAHAMQLIKRPRWIVLLLLEYSNHYTYVFQWQVYRVSFLQLELISTTSFLACLPKKSLPPQEKLASPRKAFFRATFDSGSQK